MFCFSLYSCDSIDKLKSKCSSFESEIRDSTKFKDFYQFTFNYAKNPGQKGLGRTLVLFYRQLMLCCKLNNIFRKNGNNWIKD
jgi:hypothetical protein